MTAASDRADKALQAAVESALDVYGLTGGLLATDILVVVAQRGFNEKGGVSRVVQLVTTDTSPHVLLGMLGSTRLKYERQIWDAYDGGGDE